MVHISTCGYVPWSVGLIMCIWMLVANMAIPVWHNICLVWCDVAQRCAFYLCSIVTFNRSLVGLVYIENGGDIENVSFAFSVFWQLSSFLVVIICTVVLVKVINIYNVFTIDLLVSHLVLIFSWFLFVFGNHLFYFQKKHMWTNSSNIKVPQCLCCEYACMCVCELTSPYTVWASKLNQRV